MDKAIQSLDLDKNMGMVTLSNGEELAIPKLSMSKLIKLIKFIGIDGAKLYSKFGELALNDEMDETETLVAILEELDEKQLIRVFSILLDMKDEEALSLDINEMLDILIVYSEKVDFEKTFLQIRKLAKVLLKKELPPTLGEWLQQIRPKVQVPDQEQKPLGTEVQKILQQEKDGAVSSLQ